MLTKTKVLSARVTPDVYEAIYTSAKFNNTSISDYLGKVATTNIPDYPISNIDSITMPEELKAVLVAFGGGVSGLITYKILKANLPKDRFTDEQIDFMAWIGAFAVGALGAIGTSHLIKKME
jgi:hypothetical protein